MTSSVLQLSSVTGLSSWADAAVNELTERLTDQLTRTIDVDRSVSLGSRNWDLDAACTEAFSENWDGYGAKAIDWETYALAKRFLGLLPLSNPDPEIGVDADGEVNFRWARGDREILALSLNGDGRLSFAAILGDREYHGTERFFGEQIPEDVASKMAQLFVTWV